MVRITRASSENGKRRPAQDFLPPRFSKFVPISSAFAIPFYLGPSYAVDMFIGTLVKWYWERIDPDGAEEYLTPAAAGLIVGDGLVALPANALALAHIEPPICIKFVAAGASTKARHLLSTLLTR
jgi:OPT oligopeptide transporter protein